MYKVIGQDGQEYGPVDIETLKVWAQSGNVAPQSVLRDMNTGQRIQAGMLLPLQPIFARTGASTRPVTGPPPPPSTGNDVPSAASLSDVPTPPYVPPRAAAPTTPGPGAPRSAWTDVPAKEPWHQNTGIIALLLLFCGPFGLILTWLHPRWPAGAKWVITGVIGALLLVGISNSDTSNSSVGTATTSTIATAPSSASQPAVASPAESREAKAAAAREAKVKARQEKEELAAIRVEALRLEKEQEAEAAEEARRASEEFEQDGLVLLRRSISGTRGEYGGEITGEVVNRSGRQLSYAQITFSLFDADGAQVGSAIANVNGLEPGRTWRFKATTFGQDFKRFKFASLSGF